MISYFRRPGNHTSNACERLAPESRSEQLPAHNLTQSRVSRIASAAAKFLHFEQVYRCRRRHEYERVLFFSCRTRDRMFRWRIEQAVREPSRNAMRSQIGRDLLLYLENLHLLTERLLSPGIRVPLSHSMPIRLTASASNS